MSDETPNLHRADRTRKTILRAAIREFSEHGLAGARTDAIAASAKVNKALLYYYFKSKNGLYAAALEEASAAVVERALSARPASSAGDRLLRTALNHFDRILTQREFQRLMQQEMVRLRRGQSESVPLLAKHVFKPLMEKLQQVVLEGIETGELCPVDWLQVVYCALRRKRFLFSQRAHGAPDTDLRPVERTAIECRRRAAVQFLGNALFVDRAHGANLAKRVLADMPMPKVRNARVWRKYL